ncbi:unnamed protein product [Penicillium bialowiezense]
MRESFSTLPQRLVEKYFVASSLPWAPRGSTLASTWDYGHVTQDIALIGTNYQSVPAATVLHINGTLGYIALADVPGFYASTPRENAFTRPVHADTITTLPEFHPISEEDLSLPSRWKSPVSCDYILPSHARAARRLDALVLSPLSEAILMLLFQLPGLLFAQRFELLAVLELAKKFWVPGPIGDESPSVIEPLGSEVIVEIWHGCENLNVQYRMAPDIGGHASEALYGSNLITDLSCVNRPRAKLFA